MENERRLDMIEDIKAGYEYKDHRRIYSRIELTVRIGCPKPSIYSSARSESYNLPNYWKDRLKCSTSTT